MKKVSVDEFLMGLGVDYEPLDHHYTGPCPLRQPEGHGSVFCDEGKVLTSLAIKHGGPVLEIGTDQAISTRYISEGLVHTHAGLGMHEVYTIDILQRWKDHVNWPNIIAFNMAAKDFPVTCRDFRWAFIDGDHSYDGVVSDIEVIDKALIPFVLFHDCGEAVQGQEFDPGQVIDVRRAVLDHMGDWKLTEIDTTLGMIYAER